MVKLQVNWIWQFDSQLIKYYRGSELNCGRCDTNKNCINIQPTKVKYFEKWHDTKFFINTLTKYDPWWSLDLLDDNKLRSVEQIKFWLASIQTQGGTFKECKLIKWILCEDEPFYKFIFRIEYTTDSLTNRHEQKLQCHYWKVVKNMKNKR